VSATPAQVAALQRKAKRTALEDTLCAQLMARNLWPVREHRFHPVRRWRFDLAFPDRKLAIEVDGGTWSNGRHTRGAGYAKDAEKGNAAIVLGWRVLHYTSNVIQSGEAAREIARILEEDGCTS